MRVVYQDTEMQPGCDERCRLSSHLDPEHPESPVYVIRLHSPEAHNAYGCETGRVGPPPVSWNGLYVDGTNFLLVVDERQLGQMLTRTEWQLLRALICDFGCIVPQRTLIKRTWGAEYDEKDAHLLRVHMARLRKKLFAPDRERFIENRTGIGYGIGIEPVHRALTNGVVT